MLKLSNQKFAADLDGTILNYGNHTMECRINRALIAQLLADGVKEIDIITNQGGLFWHASAPDKYPSPECFLARLGAALMALREAGIGVGAVRVATYHPNVTAEAVRGVSDALLSLLQQPSNVIVYDEPEARKPGPLMLVEGAITRYYGDSPEDMQAAEAAGCAGVLVERFV